MWLSRVVSESTNCYYLTFLYLNPYVHVCVQDERNSELVCVDTLTTLTGSSNTGIAGESKNVEAQSHPLDLSPPLSPLLPPMTETRANITASPSLPPRIAAGQVISLHTLQ